nr:hypothetical protein [uncultured Marinifilum sp.]
MNINKSNLLYFFLLLPLCLIFCSCSSDSVDINDIVPYRKIDVYLDLTYYNELTNNTALYFDYIDGNWVGYKNHGIFVYKSNGQYYCCDASCTHDVEADEHLELNDPDDDDAWNNGVTCPICGSEFILSTESPSPIPGSTAIYSLKSYNISLSGNKLHIYN